MCGRYTYSDPDLIGNELATLLGETFPLFPAHYNIPPSKTNPVVRGDGSGRLTVASMRWGLVPFWDKSEKPKFMPANARSEEMVSKPMFKQSVQQRRCVVPADGFYEWKRVSEKLKIPHYIGFKNRRPFFIGGIYEAATEMRPETYAMLTCGPNALMEPIHDRMPVILHGEALQRWLRPGLITPEEINATCVPCSPAEMVTWPVSSIVNSPKNDGPECVIPITIPDTLL